MKKGKRHQKWLNVTLAVLLAFGLWLYVVNVENPTGNIHLRDLPVSVQGSGELEENGLMVTALSRDDISIKVTGKRKTLMKLDRKDLSLYVDVSGITEEGEWPLTARVSWPTYVNTDGLTVSDWDMLEVTVTVEKRETKTVSVQGEFIGTEKEGFLADTPVTEPATIELSGPAEALDNISYALAQVGGEALSETLEELAPVVFVDQNGTPANMDAITAQEREVTVTVPVWKVVSVPLTVELLDGGGALAEQAEVRITPEKITLKEPAEESSLPESIELGSIDLGEIYDTTSYEFPVALPKGAVGLNVPDTASVRVSLKNLASRSFYAEKIQCTNVPYGFEAQPLKRGLTVWVRGEPQVVSRIAASQVEITVNLSKAKATEGVQRFPAEITLTGLEENEQAGIIGTKHSVAIRLTRSG